MKCWFDPFEEQFISPFFSDCLSLLLGIAIHTAFSSNDGAWGMWACSLFLSLQYLHLYVNSIHTAVKKWVLFFHWLFFFFIAGHMSRYCKYDFTESAMIGLSESHDISHVTSVYIWISPDNESPRIPLQNDSG